MPTPTRYELNRDSTFPQGFTSSAFHLEIVADPNITIQLDGVQEQEVTRDGPPEQIVVVTFQDDLEAQIPDQLPFFQALFPLHDPLKVDPDAPQLTRIVNEDETVANFPQTTRKTPIFQPSIIPPGQLFYGTGRFDEFTGDRKTGCGAEVKFRSSTPNDVIVLEGRFHDYVYILGGRICAWSSDMDDEVSLDTVFPASTPAATPGTGNANLDPGTGLFIPAPGNDGSHTIDGATLEVGQINRNLCPVPAANDNTGFWNWDPTQDPSITPAPNGDGAYHLLAAERTGARQANCYPVKDGEVTPAAGIQGKKVLPHWIWRFTLNKGPQSTPTECRIVLYTAREQTV